jgi:CTP synthase
LTLVPYLSAANEFKTKPTQHSVKELLGLGIQPDLLLCRTERSFDDEARKKISQFCNLSFESVIIVENANIIYEVPVKLNSQGILKQLYNHFDIKKIPKLNQKPWKSFVNKFSNLKNEVDVTIVGKYTNLSESYKSLNEALFHSGIKNNVKVNVKWLDSRLFDNYNKSKKILSNTNGILVPGGFGEDGSIGKENAIKVARKMKIPFLGICFGMQLCILESVKSLKGYEKASSTEFGNTTLPIISMLHEWTKDKKILKHDKQNLGGSMRLGAYVSKLKKESRIFKIYKKTEIKERHRHRYEVNYNFIDIIEKSGISMTGFSPDGKLVEIVERIDHPWFIGVQFHPELKSTPFNPHPIFNSFIDALIKFKNEKN